MARFERRQVLGGIENPGALEFQQRNQLADTLHGFAQYGLERYAESRIAQATKEGQAVDPSTEAPELRSEGTLTGQAYNKVVLAGHAAAVKNDYTRRIAELSVEYQDDPVAFQKAAEGYRNATLSSVTPEIRADVATDFDATLIKPYTKILNAQRQESLIQSANELIKGADIVMDDLAKAARDGDLDLVEYNSQAVEGFASALEEAGQLKAAAALRADLNDRIDEQITLGRAEDAIQSGNGAQWIQDFIDNPPEDLTPEQVDSYAATASTMLSRYETLEKKQEAGESIETARRVSNLKVAVNTGLGDPEDLMGQIEDMFDAKEISETERTSMLTKIINRDAKERAELEKFQSIAESIKGDDAVFVPQKDQDSYFEKVIVPQFSQMTPEQIQVESITFVNKTKRVPSALKSYLQNLVLSDNPENIVFATKVVDNIDQIPGLMEDTFDSSQLSFMRNVVDLSSNMEPKEAVRTARELTDPTNRDRVEARAADIKDRKLKEEYRDWAESVFDPWGPGGVELDAITGDQVSREYGKYFETFYKSGMSEQRAKEEAAKRVKRNWGEWEGRVMKYPPNQFYSVGGGTDYIKKQLVNDVVKNNYLPADVSGKDIFLFSDEQTAKSGSKPTYRVGMIRDDGTLSWIPNRWSPDVERERRRLERANKKLIDSAKDASAESADDSFAGGLF